VGKPRPTLPQRQPMKERWTMAGVYLQLLTPHWTMPTGRRRGVS
jgi:hypothetical protein